MALLDNSGDILIDAVLTDEGRKRMAEGNFKIAKFALGDDEIDYSLYNKNTTTALADVDILSTPVLEAFTNNTSSLKSKLISIPRTNLLYLPVIKLYTGLTNTAQHSTGTFLVAVDNTTFGKFSSGTAGIIYETSNNYILLDQGIDNSFITYTIPLSTQFSDLVETQYSIEIDDRIGKIYDVNGNFATPSFVDDDNVASYIFSDAQPAFVTDDNVGTRDLDNVDNATASSITGARGTSLKFKVFSSPQLKDQNNTLITRLGGTTTIGGNAFYYVDTIVKVSGLNTGYRVDIPVRFIKS
jgi:hypothetical protein